MGLYVAAGKRLLDLLVALTALLFLGPILLVVALYILAKDGRPILFAHKRVGLRGEVFRLYKFRTMVRNAEKIGPYFTDPGDPRVTSWGKFLRKYTLDELPQIFNVIKGDMSIVGPRPDTPGQIEALDPESRRVRTSVKPGMTGLAQTRGRSSLTTEQRLQYDLTYAGQVSFLHDLRIILRTALQVIRPGSGAW